MGRWKLGAFISGLLIAVVSLTQAAPLPDPKAVDVVYQAKEAIRIPTSAELQSGKVSLPAVLKKSGVLCLMFRAYVRTQVPGGWNPYLSVEVNGQVLDRSTTAGRPRLINRSAPLKTTSATREWWGTRDGAPVLLTFFTPGLDAIDSRIVDPGKDFYLYVLDISDVPDPREIVFTNHVLKQWFPKEGAVGDMVLADVTVGYLPKETVAALRGEGQNAK